MDTMRRIVHVESSYNPYAIGVVGGRLDRQPRNKAEAVATAEWLERNGYNYSVGLAQVNKYNFAKYGLTLNTAFEACPNLSAAGQILTDCFLRANRVRQDEQAALRDAFSCYYSGNFITGYKQGYVLKVVNAGQAGPKVPQVAQGAASPKLVQGELSAAPVKKNKSLKEVQSPASVAHEEAPAAPATTSQSALLF
jgi:type IV secretion system protein VirB1